MPFDSAYFCAPFWNPFVVKNAPFAALRSCMLAQSTSICSRLTELFQYLHSIRVKYSYGPFCTFTTTSICLVAPDRPVNVWSCWTMTSPSSCICATNFSKPPQSCTMFNLVMIILESKGRFCFCLMQSAFALVAQVTLELNPLFTLSRLSPADFLNAIFYSPSECQQTTVFRHLPIACFQTVGKLALAFLAGHPIFITVFRQGPDEEMTMAIFGYGRVSTSQQDTENQRLELEQAGWTFDFWFTDVVGGNVTIGAWLFSGHLHKFRA
ncbi:DNA integration/recombination/inversion protein [Serratia plymuthica 4Rx13]|nr:DNA integration/recombination/inversion protein [Serratia plymuthica 4Rx13]